LETQETTNSQGNTQQKSNAGGVTIPAFKLYYKAVAIKTAWYSHKNRHEDKWIQIEDVDMNPQSCAHLNFDNGVKNIWWRKESFFKKCCWEKWLSVCKKLKLDTCVLVYSRVLVSIQNGSRTQTSEASREESSEYSGTNRYRQGLSQ
jgi:hypothetical protein